MGEVITSKFNNNFNFIRLVASIFVILEHSWPLSGSEPSGFLKFTGSLGFFAVRIFFIISGYLIYQSYIRSQSDWVYLYKRCLRIFPGLIVVTIVAMFIVGPIVTQKSLYDYFHHPLLWSYLRNIFLFKIQWELPGVFNNNVYSNIVNGSLWTLIYEFIFYISLIVMAKLKFFKNKGTLLIIFAILFVIRILVYIYPLDNKFIFFLVHTDLNLLFLIEFGLFFLSGIILYQYKEKVTLNNFMFIAVCALWIISMYSEYLLFSSLIFLPYIVFFLSTHPRLLFLNNYMKFGDYSYGLYIYAFPVQQLIYYSMGEKLNVYAMMLLSIVCTIPLAVFSWHLIEEPALKLKHLKSTNNPAIKKE